MASRKARPSFNTTKMANVPHGRNGKHKAFVTRVVSDLSQLEMGRALKIPLEELPHSTANIRSALNRATRATGMSVATAVDSGFLYIWNS